MMDETVKLSLLPNGFVDLLPPKAEAEAQSISILMEKFKSYGYARVKPPLLEFEDSLLGASAGGVKLAPETFRLMDPISHRMLGVRSDITPQIARIATSRLGHEPRPLRLTYANDALRTRAGQTRSERQFTQVGCEIIGDECVEGDVEVCVLSVLGLKALGLKGITIDLHIPGFVARICEVLSPEAKAQTLAAVARREGAAVAKLCPLLGEVMTSGVRGVSLSPDLMADVDHLSKLEAGVSAALSDLKITDVSLSVDVLEQAGFEYHTRFGFTLFAAGVHGELGRGGGYEVRFGGTKETAKGFTLYMDTVGRALPPPAPKDTVLVSAKEPWSVLEMLQSQGHIVVRGTDENLDGLNCSHIYKDGKITAYKGKNHE